MGQAEDTTNSNVRFRPIHNTMIDESPRATDSMEQSTGLNGLISRIDELGSAICRHTGLEGHMLSMADLMDILEHLARKQPPIMPEAGAKPIPPWNLSDIVQQEIEARIKPQQKNHLLSILQASTIQATEHIFRHLEYSSDIDPAAYRFIGHLQVDITRSLLQDPNSLEGPEHPLRRFVEILLRICRLYDAFSGLRAEQSMRKIATIVERLSASPLPLDAAFEPAIDELITHFNAHNQENVALARNLIAKEQGLSLRDDAKLIVKREMLEAVEGLHLPILFVRFLERVWSKYLYITYLRHGMDSNEWVAGIESIRVLAQSLEIRGRDEMFRYYSTHVTTALATLREAAFSIHQDEFLVKNLLEQLDEIHMCILSEEDVDLGECVEIRAVKHPPDPLATSANSGQLQAVKALRVGDWYKLIESGLDRRCKLIEKNSQHAYCLFTNLSGIQMGKYSFGQVSDKLASGELLRIESTPLFEKALHYSCTELAKYLPRLEQQTIEAERARQDALQRKRREEAEVQLRAEEEQRRLRDEEILRERQRLEEARLRQEAEAQAKVEHAARQSLLQQTLLVLGRMQPGGWLELIGTDHQRIACKLGLRIKSTGKLIFVDSLGRKVAEFHQMALAERIVDGSASIMDYGVAFDETLASLVHERSEKIKTDEPQ